jgi:hypothetical protein
MYTLKVLLQMVFNLLKQIWLLPKTVPVALAQRRRQVAWQKSEVERLDRIRNPAKYAGR